jgi:2,3-bisphosphoglycerate-dependent phosphoglycerate mutase
MILYLIRHAESENNVLNQETMHRRKVDPDLTPLGYQQRDLLARHITSGSDAVGGGFAFTHLYTSAMYRSLLTTAPISKGLDMTPSVWPDLHENGGMYLEQDSCAHGYGGMTRAEIERDFPGYQLPDTVCADGWYDRALGREPEEHSLQRATKVAWALRKRADSDDVIGLVSHAGFLNILLAAIFEHLPSKRSFMRYYHDNTAITRINFYQGWATLHYLNRADHLPAEMRSF